MAKKKVGAGGKDANYGASGLPKDYTGPPEGGISPPKGPQEPPYRGPAKKAADQAGDTPVRKLIGGYVDTLLSEFKASYVEPRFRKLMGEVSGLIYKLDDKFYVGRERGPDGKITEGKGGKHLKDHIVGVVVDSVVELVRVGVKRDAEGKIIDRGVSLKDWTTDKIRTVMKPAADRLKFLDRLFGYTVTQNPETKDLVFPEPKKVLDGFENVSAMAAAVNKLREELEGIKLKPAQSVDLLDLPTRREYDDLSRRVQALEGRQIPKPDLSGLPTIEHYRKLRGEIQGLRDEIGGLKTDLESGKYTGNTGELSSKLEGLQKSLSNVEHNLGAVINQVMDPEDERLIKDEGENL